MPSTVEEASSLSCMCLEHAIYMKLSSHTVRQLYLSWGNVCETRMETKNEQNTLSTEEIPLFTFPKNFAQKMYGTRPGQLSFGESNCHWTNFCRSHVSNINSNCLIVDCCENQMSGSANYFFFSIYYCWSAVCSENQTLLWHFNDDMHHLYHHHHSTECPYTLPLSLISVETHKIEYKFCHKRRMLVLFVYHLTNLPSNEQNVVVLS